MIIIYNRSNRKFYTAEGELNPQRKKSFSDELATQLLSSYPKDLLNMSAKDEEEEIEEEKEIVEVEEIKTEHKINHKNKIGKHRKH